MAMWFSDRRSTGPTKRTLVKNVRHLILMLLNVLTSEKLRQAQLLSYQTFKMHS
jgi:hypothetical protein